MIWHLGHSGWAIKTMHHLLIFDYFLTSNWGRPDEPSLDNGFIVPKQLANEHVTVLCTHEHGDHYDAGIFEWRETLKDVRFVLGLEPPGRDKDEYLYAAPRKEYDLGDMKLTTIEANDAGVGFLVEVDGLTLFHAGDHANGRVDLKGTFPVEIDWLADEVLGKEKTIDVAFFGIRGCSLGDPVSVQEGVLYAAKKLAPPFPDAHACRDVDPQLRDLRRRSPQAGL